MEKTKKLSAVLIAAAVAAGSVTAFAEYPEPETNGEGIPVYGIIGESSICPGYPSKINGVGGDGVYKEKWITSLNGKDAVKEYSNPEKRFTIDGKNFILLDNDSEGNYFVIADDLYGKKSFADVNLGNNWNTFMYQGDFLYDPAHEKSVAKWLNNEFLTSGNVMKDGTYKLPDAIINNLVEKDWWVEGGALIADNWYYEQLGEDKPLVESVPSYKVSQKISLLSATEYHYYWQDISPLVYNGDNTLTNWDDNAWWLRTPNNIPLIGGASKDGKDQMGVYISAANANGTGMRSASTTYNQLGIRPVFWLESDFFATNRLDVLDKGAASVISELKKCSPSDLLAPGMYNIEELEAAGITLSGEMRAENVHIKGQAVSGNTISAQYVSNGDSTEIAWLHADTENGIYSIVSADEELTLTDEYGGYMKLCVTPKSTDGSAGIPGYSPVFKVEVPAKHPDNINSNGLYDYPAGDELHPLYNSQKDSFTIETDSAVDEFIILDKVYGADGKPQLFLYANHVLPSSISWASGVKGANNDNASQKYDPALEGSIAYKLANNSISSTSNMDTAFWNNLKSHNWLTEAGLEDVCPDSYYVSAKAALLSYNEYLKYSTKIGSLSLNSADDEAANVGIWYNNAYFRTPVSERESGRQTVLRMTNNSGKTVTRLSRTSNLQTYANGIRPAMYLDMNYFVNNKIDTAATASDSALYEQLRAQFTRENLIEIYGSDVDSFGLVSENDMPVLSELKINGTLAVGSTVYADYTLDKAEGDTEYQWYAMGASGVYEPIEGANQKSYKLTAGEMGREILVAVRPADSEGIKGIESTAFTSGIVGGKANTTVESSAEMTDTSVNARFEVNAVAAVDNACIVIAVYNAAGAMVDFKIVENVNIEEGANVYEASLENYNPSGVKCKAMLWKNIDTLEPLSVYAEDSII